MHSPDGAKIPADAHIVQASPAPATLGSACPAPRGRALQDSRLFAFRGTGSFVVDRLHVVVDMRFTLVFGRYVFVGIVRMNQRRMIVFVLVCRTQVLEAADVQAPVVGNVIMAVAVCHGVVSVLLPLSLGIGHRSAPFDARFRHDTAA